MRTHCIRTSPVFLTLLAPGTAATILSCQPSTMLASASTACSNSLAPPYGGRGCSRFVGVAGFLNTRTSATTCARPKRIISSCKPLTTPAFLSFYQCQISGNDIKKNLSQIQMSFSGGPEGITRIDREAMSEIIEDVANSGREESGYIIIDVRGYDEVKETGKLDECTENLPLPFISDGALSMEADVFEKNFGFEKPMLDETLVFSCKGGVRSAKAAELAMVAGYTNILDYSGGANEWFS